MYYFLEEADSREYDFTISIPAVCRTSREAVKAWKMARRFRKGFTTVYIYSCCAVHYSDMFSQDISALLAIHSSCKF